MKITEIHTNIQSIWNFTPVSVTPCLQPLVLLLSILLTKSMINFLSSFNSDASTPHNAFTFTQKSKWIRIIYERKCMQTRYLCRREHNSVFTVSLPHQRWAHKRILIRHLNTFKQCHTRRGDMYHFSYRLKKMVTVQNRHNFKYSKNTASVIRLPGNV